MTDHQAADPEWLRLPKLHRQSSGWWQITGTYISLVGPSWEDTGFWWVTSTHAPSSEWLQQHGLENADFDTRTQALRCVSAFMHLSPPPAQQEPSVKLLKLSAGHYVSSDRHWTITRIGPCWWMVQPPDGRRYRAVSLREAAGIIKSVRIP